MLNLKALYITILYHITSDHKVNCVVGLKTCTYIFNYMEYYVILYPTGHQTVADLFPECLKILSSG